MPFSVEIQDEQGRREKEPWWHPRSTELLVRQDATTCCLRFMDPYGDTTFNQAQLSILLAELERASNAVDSEGQRLIADLCQFIGQAVGQVHTYVKFIGD
jgi:hypothetical protein